MRSRWTGRGHKRLLASVTGGKSSNTVAATNIGDGSERRIHLTAGQCTFGSMAACSTAVPSRGNGSGQARLEEPLYGCFLWGVQGRRAARRPSSRRPSRFPRLRVPLRGAHINPCGPTGCRQALHQCQTQGDAHEATRSGIARPAAGGRAWAGSAPAPVSELRAPGFHTTAQAPRTPEQRAT